MNKLTYFIFGILTALFAFTIFFNANAEILLDDYYVELLYNEYFEHWKCTDFIIKLLFIFNCIMWVYHQGMLAAKELSIQVEEDNKKQEE